MVWFVTERPAGWYTKKNKNCENRKYQFRRKCRSGTAVYRTMKTCFKSVYGCSIYAYMKSYRMQATMLLLRDTVDSITEIVAKRLQEIVVQIGDSWS